MFFLNQHSIENAHIIYYFTNPQNIVNKKSKCNVEKIIRFK
jgi:hypothetical protein